jgi:uncharacterized lipoprotein YddW (UPF0748 family)
MRLLAASVLLIGVAAAADGQTIPDSLRPPEINREFRALWVATVRNMDWPSSPNITVAEQQQELLALLDRAVELKLNAIVFQVRPEADALYKSATEPWSRYLTGQQGRAPVPLWDPLEFAVVEARRRGLELHAWFNPYRAAYNRDAQTAASHVSKRRPDLIIPYAQYLWMDPGIPEVRRRMIRTVIDVVKRYDIDAVHIDDYFYPYPETTRTGTRIPFLDDKSYRAYQRSGGKLSLGDWRRNNVNTLIREFYAAVKAEKKWVKVGISPFGIWRPGYPPTTTAGIDTYNELFADSKKWLNEGWLDYLAPQLYWPVQPPEQSYPVLLEWWVQENTKGRHIWPGLPLYKLPISGPRKLVPMQIAEQIRSTRGIPGATGHVHFNAAVLMQNVEGIADTLAALYAEPALIPASPWLDDKVPSRPVASAARDSTAETIDVRFAPVLREDVRWWVVQSRVNDEWVAAIVPGAERRHLLTGDVGAVNLVAVTAVDRNGNASIPALVRPR